MEASVTPPIDAVDDGVDAEGPIPAQTTQKEEAEQRVRDLFGAVGTGAATPHPARLPAVLQPRYTGRQSLYTAVEPCARSR
eukprot:COSAG05_NODE_3230_length_2221_cov_2428.137931_5_plen_81_part_00